MVPLDIFESAVHQTTFATMVSLSRRAVHQILLTQRHQVTGLLEMLTFQGSCGTERPARTARALVLNL